MDKIKITQKSKLSVSKRNFNKKVLSLSGAALLTAPFLPKKWTKPVINSVLMPAHAQTSDSGAGSAGGAPIVGVTCSEFFSSNGTFTVPAGATAIEVVTIGASGGAGSSGNGGSVGGSGGLGSQITATITVSGGQTFAVTVGQAGQDATTNPAGANSGSLQSGNGSGGAGDGSGGTGGTGEGGNTFAGVGGGGGGASSFGNIIVASGGGGGGGGGAPGAGGNTAGGNGSSEFGATGGAAGGTLLADPMAVPVMDLRQVGQILELAAVAVVV